MVYKRVKPILEAQQSKGQIKFRSSVGVDDAFAVFENVCSKSLGWSVPMWCASFLFSRSFLAARKFSGAGLLYWAASRHRLCLYWSVSRCAVGREGVSPDLPLPGWESIGRHSWAGVGEELAEGWKISVQVVVGGKIFKQKTGSEGRGCCMGKESRPAGHQSRCRGCAELAWASMRIKLDASLLHPPPTSMPRTTKRHRRLHRSSG